MDSKIFNLTLIILIIVFTFENDFTDGARFGGSRSGSRFGGSRYSYRSSSYRSSSYRSSSYRYGSTRYSSSSVRVRYGTRYRYSKPWGYGYYPTWHDYAVAGYVYGYHGYTSRSYYHSHGRQEPMICHNTQDYKSSNGTTLSWFICPLDDQPDNYQYCCGDDDREYCCKYWDDAGRVGGLIAGLVFGVVMLIALLYCCCCRSQGGKQPFFQERVMSRRTTVRAGTVSHYKAANTDPPISDLSPQPMYPVTDPQQPAYPIYPQPDVSYAPDPYAAPIAPPNYSDAASAGAYPPGQEASYPIHPGYPPQPPMSSPYPQPSLYPDVQMNTPYPINPPEAGYSVHPTGSGVAPSAPPSNDAVRPPYPT